MGIVVSAKLHMSGAHNPQKATPILRLCYGVFTDRFIFRHILGQFFARNEIFTTSINAFEV